MIRRLIDITPVTTSHGVEQKRILLPCNEYGYSLNRNLRAGKSKK